MITNILIVGVGGQGTLLASRVLGNYAALLGLDCKLSEVHGMAQRGGSVVTHVRIGQSVLSPIVTEGQADIIISFEKLEAMRWRHYLKAGGMMVVNDQEIMPMPVITGACKYPHDVLQLMAQEGINLTVVNATEIAKACGNPKVMNTIMIGLLAKKLKMKYENIKTAIELTVAEKLKEINILALSAGFEM